VVHLNNKIDEVIVTTLSANGCAHSAPMGITRSNGQVLIQPFKPSTTYDNLKAHRQCTINYTDDVRVFAGAVTGRRTWNTLPCQQIEGEYLEQALAHIELELVIFDDSDPRASFTGTIIKEVMHAPFCGFNRAQNAVIEAAVLTSRLNILPEDKIKQEISYLRLAIEKTGGDRERQAWGWLMDKIEDYGIELTHD